MGFLQTLMTVIIAFLGLCVLLAIAFKLQPVELQTFNEGLGEIGVIISTVLEWMQKIGDWILAVALDIFKWIREQDIIRI